MQARRCLRIAAIAGFSGVAFGAFGAHGLKGVIAPELMAAYQTAVLYHLVHAVVLLALSAWLFVRPASWIRRSAWMMTIGLLLFSGSLYAMALTGEKALGIITPFGGVSWLVGWSFLLLAAFRLPESES
ncbi:DUF423 domain-containing protein [Thalassolituus sp.]|jgi:uncharacterized membrane protein YgdD (TMEM256/DUF423 family)|uniref:DUF423 domain-containing protein n=1 Tax=Thalassolituus sp. TaxID=2030822 RepID=UPI0026233BD4|nr:DUF423 domain-containing protein [uncultured Thalassolituus sp.]